MSLVSLAWNALRSPGMWLAPSVPLLLFLLLRRSGVRVQKIAMYLSIGILIGPSGLGLVFPGLKAILFPYGIDPLSFMSNAATIAMGFLAGCHIAADEEASVTLNGDEKKVRAVSVVQIGSIMILTVVLGLGIETIDPALAGRHPWLMIAALAVVLPVNALSVLTASLIEEGWQNQRFGKLAMRISVNTEVYLWPALTVLSFFDTRPQATSTLANLVRVTEVAAYGVSLYLVNRHLLPKVKKSRIIIQLFVIICLLWLSVGVSEYLELHSLLGALLAGLVSASIAGPYTRKVTLPIRYGVMPYFLVGVGFLVPFNFQSIEVWIITAALVSTTTIVQTIAVATMMHARLKLLWRDAVALGVLSLTRGKTDIIVMGQTVDMGFTPPPIYAAFVLMSLIQLCLAPIAAHAIRESEPPQPITEFGIHFTEVLEEEEHSVIKG